MGKHTAIEWAHHTFNPWEGCIKESPACTNCYAETRAIRFGHSKGGKHPPLWGPSSRRKFRSEQYWKQPIKWNREAQEAGERRRVFCMSLGDVFEEFESGHPDREAVHCARLRLWDLIEATPHLDWMLLTKRPQNIQNHGPWLHQRFFLPNVWLGTTVENQAMAEERIPTLLRAPAQVHFVSCEPLLESIDISQWFYKGHCPTHDGPWGFCHGPCPDDRRVGWVIEGGESGRSARPSKAPWFRDLRDQCAQASAPFFFKQWGAWCPVDQLPPDSVLKLHPKSGDHCRWDSSVGVPPPGMPRPGKKLSGRLLDGVEHHEFPNLG